jgi:TonB family protein
MRKLRKQNIPLVLTVVLSLFLHVALFAFLVWNPKFNLSQMQHKNKTEVELLDPQELLKAMQKKIDDPVNGQIVEQDEKALNNERDKKAKFLSRHNQKVVQETQSVVHGKFKNTDGTAGEKSVEREAGKTPEQKIGKEADKDQLVEQKVDKQNEPKNLLTSTDGIATKAKPSMKDLTPSFKPGPPPSDSSRVAKGGGDGQSASDDHLKDVKTGMQTLLSTREFVYYSYYNRIKDRLRQYWEPKIKEKMERIVRQGRTIASNQDRITRIVIILDKSGTLVRVQIIGPSGVNDLDEAAVEAFRAAAPFPNPPKGIVDGDGTIKIHWDFILEANAGSLLNAMNVARIPD